MNGRGWNPSQNPKQSFKFVFMAPLLTSGDSSHFSEIDGNFNKFLVDRQGKPFKRYQSVFNPQVSEDHITIETIPCLQLTQFRTKTILSMLLNLWQRPLKQMPWIKSQAHLNDVKDLLYLTTCIFLSKCVSFSNYWGVIDPKYVSYKHIPVHLCGSLLLLMPMVKLKRVLYLTQFIVFNIKKAGWNHAFQIKFEWREVS